jgi:hypothetical protein
MWATVAWGLAALPATLLPAAEVTENLILDGGMEEWKATWWNYLTVSCKKIQLARDEQGRVLTPKTFSQTYDLLLMKPESGDVHSGQRTLRMKGNSTSDPPT